MISQARETTQIKGSKDDIERLRSTRPRLGRKNADAEPLDDKQSVDEKQDPRRIVPQNARKTSPGQHRALA
jgi:hypothetical protein